MAVSSQIQAVRRSVESARPAIHARPLRIGIVAENYFPTFGGIQEHILHLKRFLTAAGMQVSIITGVVSRTDGPPGPEDADDRVVRPGRGFQYGVNGTYTQATIGVRTAWRMRRLLREGRFDLVNVHGPCDFGLPSLVQTFYRGPKVLTLHSCFPHAWWRRWAAPYYRWVLGRAAGVIAVSEATRQALARYANFDAEIIPNGVDCDYWRSGDSSPRYREAGTRTLLYVGRLEERNGFDLMIDAFVRLARRRPDVRLVVAGDGPKRAEYERAIPPDLANRVRFVGAVYRERPQLFASADMMVLPARAVGFSILVLEAFAAGLPVVALPALGVASAGDHWRNVILADEPTGESLARAVARALETDQAHRTAAGRTVADGYDWSTIGPRILDVFARAAGRGTTGDRPDVRSISAV